MQYYECGRKYGGIMKPYCLKKLHACEDIENNKNDAMRMPDAYLLEILSTLKKDIWCIKKSIYIYIGK